MNSFGGTNFRTPVLGIPVIGQELTSPLTGLITLLLWIKRWNIKPPWKEICMSAPLSEGLDRAWIVAAVASLVFLAGILSPPHLMDDVDAVQAQAARNMLASGDWVTARLDGVAYLEKAPLNYWMIAVAYRILGSP